MYSHQDWNVVVLRKKDNKTTSVNEAFRQGQAVQTIAKTKPTETLVSLNKLDDNPEDFKHKKVPKEIAEKIIRKRIELKLTQADLAKKINVPVAKIQEVEAMKSVYDANLLNKIRRAINY